MKEEAPARSNGPKKACLEKQNQNNMRGHLICVGKSLP